MSVYDYLQELNKIELLEPQHERSLWLSYKESGDLNARGQLIEHYQPLVFKIANRFKARESLTMDLIQEGTVGLIEAVEKYDALRQISFSLYAVHRIRGRMLNYIAKEGKQNWAYMDSPLEDDDTCTFGDCLTDGAPSVTQDRKSVV